jgi:hypothetical protein
MTSFAVKSTKEIGLGVCLSQELVISEPGSFESPDQSIYIDFSEMQPGFLFTDNLLSAMCWLFTIWVF